MSGGPEKPKPTKQERALAERAAADWNRYVGEFIPLENRIINDIQNSEKYTNEMRGMAATDVGLQATGQLDNASGSIGGQSAKGVRALTNLASQQGAAKGAAIAGADSAIRDREMRGLASLSGFGRGLSGLNTSALSQSASNAAARSLNQYQFDAQLKNNYGNMAGQVVGMGIGSMFPPGGAPTGAPTGGPTSTGGQWFDPGSTIGYGGGG